MIGQRDGVFGEELALQRGGGMLVKMASRAIPSSAGSYCFESGIGPHARQVVVGASQPTTAGRFRRGAAQQANPCPCQTAAGAAQVEHHAFDQKKLYAGTA